MIEALIFIAYIALGFLITDKVLASKERKQLLKKRGIREDLHSTLHSRIQDSLVQQANKTWKTKVALEAEMYQLKDETEGLDMNIDELFSDIDTLKNSLLTEIEDLKAVNHTQNLMFQCLDQGLKFNQIDQLAVKVVDAEIVDETEE